MSTHNLKDFKKAKAIKKDLEDALSLVSITLPYFKKYGHLQDMAKVLIALTESRTRLQAFVNKYNNVIKSKGKVE